MLGTELSVEQMFVYCGDEDEENAESEALSASMAQSHSAERGSDAGGNGVKISVAEHCQVFILSMPGHTWGPELAEASLPHVPPRSPHTTIRASL